jgi:DNA-binding transcriptional LysR family regulator
MGRTGYDRPMELRQLEAFVAVAGALHFGRAADQLHVGAPTLSELVRRLERELGAPLFTRTTRRVVLTDAGAELLPRARAILEEVWSAQAAVRRITGGEAGTVRVGITPPVGPILAPHLIGLFAAEAPLVTVEVRRMWLPDLAVELAAGDIDVAMTCGLVPEAAGVANEVFCAEPLLVGVRADHRLADRDTISLCDLVHDVLGVPPEALFSAWALAQRQALETAGVTPPIIDLVDIDLAAARWVDQSAVDWILLIPSLSSGHTSTVIRPVEPSQLVPFTLQWNPNRANSAAVARFVHTALATEPPPGWQTQPDHLHHDAPGTTLSRAARRGPLAGIEPGPAH